MLEYRGNTYQTGNGTPNDARKVLKALARAELEEIYSILSNRRPERVRVDKVEDNAGELENE